MKKGTEILNRTIAGIGYGNKYAGTTVICYNSAHKVRFIESSRNTDADAFLLTELAYLRPDVIMIDAPLSLPGVFWLGDGYGDHFYRKCDRELKAMSPMLLGGLTARAINLRKCMNGMGTRMLETYPRKLVEIMGLPDDEYKNDTKDLIPLLGQLVRTLGVRINVQQVTSWHHFDALLAFLSGIRYLENKAKVYGIPEEGMISV
jgi:predicted nuclease with RNAse H fold